MLGTTTVRLLQLAGLAAFIAAWQAAGSVRPQFYSSPSRVLAEFRQLFTHDDLLGRAAEGDSLLSLALGSLWVLVLGLSIAFVLGVSVGMLMGRFRVVRVALEPYMAAFYSIPRVAFVPVMVIWFGIDREFVVASVIVASSILLTFSTAAGVKESLARYSEVASAFQLTGWKMFTKTILPGSVPFIATGMRLAVQRALVAVIVAEFLIGVPGLGFIIRLARVSLDADRLFAMAILLMVVGVALISLTKYVENRLSAWRPQAF